MVRLCACAYPHGVEAYAPGTCMRGVRSREAACPQHAHKKKHTDKDVCGPEVARTHGLGMRINYKYKSAKQTPLELCLKMAASLTACKSLL